MIEINQKREDEIKELHNTLMAFNSSTENRSDKDNFLGYLFLNLLNSFKENQIQKLYVGDNYGLYEFSVNTIGDDITEIKNKVAELNMNISFEYPINGYQVSYRFGDKNYLCIKAYYCEQVNYTNKNYFCYGNKKFEIIIYSKDAIYMKTLTGKIFPLKLSSTNVNKDEIFIRLFNVLKDYNPIYKDISREIFIPRFLNIDLSTINQFYNKKDLFEHLFSIKLHNAVNKLNFSQLYMLCCALVLVDKKYENKIYDYIFNNPNDLSVNLNTTNKQTIGIIVLSSAYIKIFPNIFFNNGGHDYIRIIEKYLTAYYRKYHKIKLTPKNKTTILKIISEENIIETNKKFGKSFSIPRSSKFNKLNLPKEFHRIRNRTELVNLSKKMHMDIISISSSLQKDKNALYYIDFDGYYFAVLLSCSNNNGKNIFAIKKIMAYNRDSVNYDFYNDVSDIINLNNKRIKMEVKNK